MLTWNVRVGIELMAAPAHMCVRVCMCVYKGATEILVPPFILHVLFLYVYTHALLHCISQAFDTTA